MATAGIGILSFADRPNGGTIPPKHEKWPRSPGRTRESLQRMHSEAARLAAFRQPPHSRARFVNSIANIAPKHDPWLALLPGSGHTLVSRRNTFVAVFIPDGKKQEEAYQSGTIGALWRRMKHPAEQAAEDASELAGNLCAGLAVSRSRSSVPARGSGTLLRRPRPRFDRSHIAAPERRESPCQLLNSRE